MTEIPYSPGRMGRFKWWPQPFPPDLEQQFCQQYNRHWGPIRRFCGRGVMVIWALLIPWDCWLAMDDAAYANFLPIALALRLTVIGGLLALEKYKNQDFKTLNQPGHADFWLACAALGLSFVTALWIWIVPSAYGATSGILGLVLVTIGSYTMFGIGLRAASWMAVAHLLMMWVVIGRLSQQLPGEMVGLRHTWALMLISVMMGLLTSWLIETDARRAFRVRHALFNSNVDLANAKASLEERLLEVNRLQAILAQETQVRDRERAQFLAGVVHDLRQPVQALGALRTPIRRALERQDGQALEELLDLSQRATVSLQDQLGAILEISRLESGAIQPQVELLCMASLLRDIHLNWQAAAKESGVDLVLELPPSHTAVVVQSDEGLLRRILGNLISNGIKYRKPAREHQAEVRLTLRMEGSQACIQVRDNGIGIHQDHLDSGEVFKPFVQMVPQAQGSSEGGVGLGLAIVQRLVGLLEGHRLNLTSQWGVGTAANLRLVCTDQSAQMPSPSYLAQPNAAWLDGAYILVVEDDELVRLALRSFFLDQHAHVDVFADHASFEAALLALERSPDVVISDYRLPSGRTAVDVRLSLSEQWGDVPLMVLSGEAMDMRQQLALAQSPCLRKPVDTAQMLACLQGLLSPA